MSAVEGRVALVTGASSGIGAATARALAAGGAHVALASRRGGDLGIEGALAHSCDVRDSAAGRGGWWPHAWSGSAALDILVVNAGVGAYGDFLDLKPGVAGRDDRHQRQGLALHDPRRAAAPARELLGRPGGGRVDRRPARRPRARRSTPRPSLPRSASCARSTTSCSAAACAARSSRPAASRPSSRWAAAANPDDPDLAGMMRAEEVADAVMYAVTRPRTHRMLEASILPMSDDSMG